MRVLHLKALCAAIILLTVTVCVVSCDAFDARVKLDKAFTANVEGEIDGRKISARVYCDPTEHITKEIYVRLSVSMLTPASLQGVTLTLRSDGKASIRLGQNTVEGANIDGMLAPFLAIFPDGEYSSVEKNDGGFLATWRRGSDAVTLNFDKDMVPKSAEGCVGGRIFSLNITDFCEKDK